MNKRMTLEDYGNVFSAICNEGLGYYVMDYASKDTFDGDEELKGTFMAANKALAEFSNMVNKKIIDNGGNPDDYEM